MRIPFGYAYDKARSKSVSVAAAINLYPEVVERNLRTQIVLYGTPGLKLFGTAGTGPIRGAHRMGGVLYVVSGTKAYRISSAGTATELGTIPGTGRVPMADNGAQIAALADNTAAGGYIITLTGVEQITDTDFPGAESVSYIDGYFVFAGAGGQQFFISALDDGKTYDALDFASAEGNPDDLVGVLVDHREVWLFGTESTEIWYNSGASDFPLERVSGAFIEKGCASPTTTAKLDNTVFWLGDDRIVYRAQAYTPTRISTHAIEKLLSDQDDLSDCFAFTYTQEGHAFYSLTKPGAWTVVYDVATGLWHQRRSYDRDDWKVNAHCFAYGKHIVGDDTTGKLYELDLDTYDEDGDPLVASVVSPPIWAEAQRATMDSLVVDIEAGVGLTTGQGSDPQIMLDWSKDGGFTWSSQLSRPIGAKGRYADRVKWNRIGSFRQLVLRVSISDPVKRAILGAYGEIDGGAL